MRKVIISRIALICCLVMVLCPFIANAATYTYSIDGESLISPDAYSPYRTIDSSTIGLAVPLSSPSDIKTDSDGNIYIADPFNNRVVVLDKYYNLKFEISQFTNMNGIAYDSLSGCQGVFVWEGVESDGNDGYINEKYIYVADTENMRIVIFDANGKYLRHLDKPSSDVLEEGEIYKPKAVAVSSSKRIYVVSPQLYQGVMTLNDDGEFCGYIGATKAVYSLFDIIWRNFQTQEQLEASEKNISSPFNNITIDDEGFLWVTKVPPPDEAINAEGALYSKVGDYATVKKINTSGDDIMKRNGFFAPMGEVAIFVRSSSASSFGQTTGISDIVSIAMGEEGTYSIIDEKRSKVYTYNKQGELLFAFGDKPGTTNGAQTGEFNKVSSIAYHGSDMLILDAHTNSFTIFKRTEYGDLLLTAIKHNNNREFELSIDDWKAVLQRNNNFDAAYIGLGDAYYRNGDYETAMEYYKVAYDTVGYSAAFKLWRKAFVEKNIIWIIVVPVVAIFLIGWLFRFAAKVNAKAAISGRRKTFKEEFFYAFHLIFHPFDGFWDLKHEKRGSVRGALAWLGLAVLAFTYQAVGEAFIFNPRGSMSSVIMQLSALLVPLLLWTIANWCLTTLFNGEGSLKDVFIASCYSLAPIPLIIFITTLLTYCVTDTEATFITLIISVCYVWIGLLLFCSTMVTHDYSLGKNIATILGTIGGMAIIMFICALFTGLFTKMISFISNIITEIQYRS